MTSANQARQEVYETFKTGWETAFPGVPIQFGNEAFDSEGVEEYVRFIVRQTTGGQDSLGAVGSRRFERRGLAIAQFYAAVNRGLARLDEMGNTVLGLLEGKTLPVNNVFLHSGVYNDSLPPEGQWSRGSVTVQMTYDEIK